MRPNRPAARVLVMSGMAEPPDGTEAGPAFVAKPFTAALLEQAVRRALA